MADELCAYLKAKYPDHFICGDEDANLLLWGAQDEDTGEVVPKVFSLLIGLEYDPLTPDLSDLTRRLNDWYRCDPAFKSLLSFGKEFSSISHLPFLVIAYPALREHYNGRWEDTRSVYPEQAVQFLCRDFHEGSSSVLLSGAQLAEKIHQLLGIAPLPGQLGTAKDKNKRLADYFHLWSRDMLATDLTKFDIDGFLVNRRAHRGLLIEVKRSSKPPIPHWRPNYDKADYLLQSRFSKIIGADFWLLHHEDGPCDDQTEISWFQITGVDPTKSRDFLRGPKVLQMPLGGACNSLEEKIAAFLA